MVPFQSSDSIFIDDKKVHSVDNTIGNILYLDDLSEPVRHMLLHVINSPGTNWYNKTYFFFLWENTNYLLYCLPTFFQGKIIVNYSKALNHATIPM